jgi:hypothetical protein
MSLNVDTNEPWNEQVFTSDFLFRRCEHMMRKKGYVVRTKLVWNGETRVTWRQITPPKKSTLDSEVHLWDVPYTSSH